MEQPPTAAELEGALHALRWVIAHPELHTAEAFVRARPPNASPNPGGGGSGGGSGGSGGSGGGSGGSGGSGGGSGGGSDGGSDGGRCAADGLGLEPMLACVDRLAELRRKARKRHQRVLSYQQQQQQQQQQHQAGATFTAAPVAPPTPSATPKPTDDVIRLSREHLSRPLYSNPVCFLSTWNWGGEGALDQGESIEPRGAIGQGEAIGQGGPVGPWGRIADCTNLMTVR